MSESASRKPVEEAADIAAKDSTAEQVIRLDERKHPTIIEIGPAGQTPAALEAPVEDKPFDPVSPAAVEAKPAGSKRNWKRQVLFGLLPVALIVGGYYYALGGQVMTTDNAYIQARVLGVSTDVSGTVAEIDVHENEPVKKGQVLFRLKSDSFKTALAAAKAQLGTVRNQVLTLHASYAQALAAIDQAKADIPYYEAAFQRQKDLLKTSTASKASFDEAQHDLIVAQQKVSVAQAAAQAMLAQLGGDANQTVEDNPFYLQAQSALEDAQRNIDDSIVRAPFDGVATNVDSIQPGRYLPASTPALSLVSTRDVWIEAEPKETELTYVRPGQPVTVSVDTYPGVEWKGEVASISPASSSSFSLLPAQNTTGNWVKVVQRIPMRISVEGTDGKPPLRAGMSVEASVDTGHRRGLPGFMTDVARKLGVSSWLGPLGT